MSPIYYDLSRAITPAPSCGFSPVDNRPQLSLEEGNAHGFLFISSRLDNLHSNVATHIDFPGHIATPRAADLRTVGEYPVERFCGPVGVLDVSSKLDPIRRFFSTAGYLEVNPQDEQAVWSFLQALGAMKITRADLDAAESSWHRPLSSLRGLLLYSGAGAFWQYKTFESWNYIYFYSPYLDDDACAMIVESGMSFIGIDAFQIEDPIINLRGDELLVVLHRACRLYVEQRLSANEVFSNHSALLDNDVLIYEGLAIPEEVVGRTGMFSGVPLNFRIPGMNDNALVRPYIVLEEI
jgi:kynurenine formamidase